MPLDRLFSYCLFGIAIYIVTGTAGNESIIGDEIAKDNHQFPYHVSLQWTNRRHFCGGGIIETRFILTAAHCFVNNFNNFYNVSVLVIAGTHDLRMTEKPAVIGHVQKVYMPKEFDPFHNSLNDTADIAVIRLKEPLHLWKHGNMMKLKLPNRHDEFYVGRAAMFVGFGHFTMNLNNIIASDLLKYSKAYVISIEHCQLGYPKRIISKTKSLCAKLKQQRNVITGTCRGDSGSPLVIDGKHVIGILSIGPDVCNEMIAAGVYTCVASYLEFIHDAMKDKENNETRTIEFTW